MLDSIQALLDVFPDGVIQVSREGAVRSANAAARRWLPALAPGEPLPDCVPLPEGGGPEAGAFGAGSSACNYFCGASGEGYVVLLRPAPTPGLRDWQLDGALSQLRGLLGELLAEAGPVLPPGEPAAAFGKTLCRLLRLTGNLELAQAMGAGELPFRPVAVDLDSLCRETAGQAGGLLAEAGIDLEYRFQGRGGGLLVPGDPELLRELLLSLISNAARASEGGRVSLTLQRQGDRAVAVVSNSGPEPGEEQLAAFFRDGPGDLLPRPGQGAGLGLSIARHILELHRGDLRVRLGGGCALSVLLYLPTGPLDGRAPVRTPPPARWAGGLDPVLLELSDLLPARLFGLEELD